MARFDHAAFAARIDAALDEHAATVSSLPAELRPAPYVPPAHRREV